MDRKAWRAAVHGVANSCIRLSDCTELTEERTEARELRRQAEKGMTEDEMAGSHHQLDGHEFG